MLFRSVKTKQYTRCGAAQAATAPSAPAPTAGDFAGRYAGSEGSYKWTATIAPKGSQSYSVEVKVGATVPACGGEFEGVGQLQAGRIVRRPEHDDSCVLRISRSAGGISVVERSCDLDHGQACGFTSRMKKVGQ